MCIRDSSNIDVRMYFVEEGGAGFHTKGYMFREEEIYKIIVGSSNMTMHALAVNKDVYKRQQIYGSVWTLSERLEIMQLTGVRK